jgi:tetratricopeptide (TPR) repeat protein
VTPSTAGPPKPDLTTTGAAHPRPSAASPSHGRGRVVLGLVITFVPTAIAALLGAAFWVVILIGLASITIGFVMLATPTTIPPFEPEPQAAAELRPTAAPQPESEAVPQAGSRADAPPQTEATPPAETRAKTPELRTPKPGQPTPAAPKRAPADTEPPRIELRDPTALPRMLADAYMYIGSQETAEELQERIHSEQPPGPERQVWVISPLDQILLDIGKHLLPRLQRPGAGSASARLWRIPIDAGTLPARRRLAELYWSDGRRAEAIKLQESVLADSERLLGRHHPATKRARRCLATFYGATGRIGDAIALQREVVRDSQDLHPEALCASSYLARLHWAAGGIIEAVDVQEKALELAEVYPFGPQTQETLRASSLLATLYWAAGRPDEAIALEERVLAASAQWVPAISTDIMYARAKLAGFYSAVGRTAQAADEIRSLLTDFERAFAPRPGALSANPYLVGLYQLAGLLVDVDSA